MSKTQPQSYIKIISLFLALQIFTEVRAQDVYANIIVETDGRAHVEGRFANGYLPENGRIVSFRNQVIGDNSLAKRISALQFITNEGTLLKAQPMRDSEFVLTPSYSGWRYILDLKDRPNRSTAHASWLSDGIGVLMLDDLLPIFGGDRRKLKAAVSLKLPNGWVSLSSDEKKAEGQIDVRSVEGSVIYIGDRLRNIPIKSGSGKLSLLLSGNWIFTDAEAAQMASEIFDSYERILGRLPTERSTVALLKFPAPENPGVWEAETRGSTVTVVSSDTHFKTQSQQRLHEQLRHEIFHLWFPNAVDLTGDYAWFYEGFALYESLKLGVALKRIRFDDYLDTLSRAYSIDASSKPSGPYSGSFKTDPTLLYARGMIIAFLTDLSTLRESGGKIDSSAKLRELFARHKPPAAAAEAATALSEVVSEEVIKDQILGSGPIDWTRELMAAGLEAARSGRSWELKVTAKPSSRQKAILKRLGYN